MEAIIKYIASVIIVIVWLLFSIAETAYCQHSKGGKGDNGKEIVHNDQTGIVIDIIDNGNHGKTVKVSDMQTSEELVSIPTHLNINNGSRVIFRKISGDAYNNSNGNANSHCKNDMCEIISVEN